MEDKLKKPGPAVALTALAFFLAGLLAGCQGSVRTTAHSRSGPSDWLAWQARRTESLVGTNGWTTLVARHWLAEGANFVGSDPTNHVVLPPGRAPGSVGNFARQAKSIRFETAPGVSATVAGQAVGSADLTSDAGGAPTILRVGDLTFVVIERGDRLGLRVRDPQSPARLHFAGLNYFPYDPEWRVEGRFERFPTPRRLRVADVAGGTQEFDSPGALVFTRGGTEHRLEVADEPGEDSFFVIFRDRTSGRSTYGGGRFLQVPHPGDDGRVTIDFNRAYTPPCGFTPFATCPLPPEQNSLPFAVRAGERKPAPHE